MYTMTPVQGWGGDKDVQMKSARFGVLEEVKRRIVPMKGWKAASKGRRGPELRLWGA